MSKANTGSYAAVKIEQNQIDESGSSKKSKKQVDYSSSSLSGHPLGKTSIIPSLGGSYHTHKKSQILGGNNGGGRSSGNLANLIP
jgi:hypothetical protein